MQLGLISKSQYTPLLAYINTLMGVNEAYRPSAKILSDILQIQLGSTGVQNTTERIGSRLDSTPAALIPPQAESEPCSLLVVTYDASGCPRISDEPNEGPGRERLKNPTVAKMCTVVKTEKYFQLTSRLNAQTPMPASDKSYLGACFGDNGFEEVREYISEMAWRSGQSCAQKVVVLADGLRSNWTTAEEYFPKAQQILDIMHAKEHLANFSRLLKCSTTDQLPPIYYEWERLMEQGEITELIGELKSKVYFGDHIKKGGGDKAVREVEYFCDNANRMVYDEYLKQGYPIGSGTIESGCKQVVGKRFKKQGMRWSMNDSQSVLNGRLHYLNGTLKETFKPKSFRWSPAKAA